MQRIHKFLSFLLAILMVISIVPLTASAETRSGTCGDNLTWTLDDAGVLTISGTGPMYDHTWGDDNIWRDMYYDQIGTIVINDGVTTIGDLAFYGLKNLVSVSIPDTVTSIGYYALADCDSLKSIIIPDSVTTIKHSALRGNDSLKSVKLPSELQTIETVLFSDCYNLKSIIIPEKVTSIGAQAFANCDSLTTVTFPDSVQEIHQQVFYDCPNLTEIKIGKGLSKIKFESIYDGIFPFCENLANIIVDSENAYFSTDENGVLFNKDKTKLVYYPTGLKGTHYSIPDGVTIIDEYAFYNYDILTSVSVPTSVKTIRERAFAECDNLCNAYYAGTKAEWNSISGLSYRNGSLYYANIHFPDENGHLHFYNETITPPTCTEKGYTTYTCECGDSFVGKNVNVISHSIVKYERQLLNPTCTNTGKKEIIERCEGCGKVVGRETITLSALGHNPATAVEESYVAPTCTENGSKDVVVYCSVCDEEISRETVVINATGHADNDGDGYCDADNELLDPTVECECNCHKTGISKFFFKFALFFQKLFGSNKTCACGAEHY